MIPVSSEQSFIVVVSSLAWVGAASAAIQVSHGDWPAWCAWYGFLASVLASAGTGILMRGMRHAQRENVVKLHGMREP